jgi:hypothetical protein
MLCDPDGQVTGPPWMAVRQRMLLAYPAQHPATTPPGRPGGADSVDQGSAETLAIATARFWKDLQTQRMAEATGIKRS